MTTSTTSNTRSNLAGNLMISLNTFVIVIMYHYVGYNYIILMIIMYTDSLV